MPEAAEVRAGLEGVIAAKTELSHVDGQAGRLIYRGYSIHDLAENCTFEEVAYLFWYGRLPTRGQLEHLVEKLKARQTLPGEMQHLVTAHLRDLPPMAALRTAVSALAAYDPQAEDMSEEANLEKAIRLTAQFPTIVAAHWRTRAEQEPVQPRTDLPLAANFLYMLHNEEPDPELAKALDLYLVLLVDHGFNASTFAARVTTSTLSDMYSAVTTAIGTLKGPLHGGATEKVMDMLMEISSKEKAEAYVLDKLAKKERIMGFGHRVYKTDDPRATHLRKKSLELGQKFGETRWHETALVIEEVMEREKHLNCNVDFYSAPVLHFCGIPSELFTPLFAMSRIVGWTAHIMEQLADNRLIRPLSAWAGPEHVEFVPIEKRGGE